MADESIQIVVRGSDGQQERRTLQDGATVIGRDPDCAIRLVDATVSRHHATIERDNGRFRVTDLGSANGTSVNGAPLVARTPVPLREGDEVTIGSFRLVIERLGPAVGVPSSPVQPAQPAPPFGGSAEPFSPQYPPPAYPPASPPRRDFTPPPSNRMTGPPPAPYSAPSSELAPAREMTSIGVGYQPPRLIVWDRGRTREYAIPAAGLTIGRDPASTVVVDDPQVSRRHAEIRHSGGGYEIIDQGSTYGLIQGGQRVGRKMLVDNDAFQVSDAIQIAFRSGAAVPPPPSPATLQIDFGQRDTITVGRDPSNDIPLNHP
ncbi:MAG: FHA domain-containing protein, partial [Dehalococcoidia bacterium]